MRLQYFLFIPLYILAIAPQTYSYTELRGVIYDGNGGPLPARTYYIDDWVTVPEGQTLTIQAGAIFKMRFNAFQVSGTLNVNGQSDNKVYFTSDDDNTLGETISGSDSDPNPGDWNVIHYEQGSGGTINYAVFRYGGFYAESLLIESPITVSNCEFYENRHEAIEVRSTSCTLQNLMIEDNAGHGILLAGAEASAVTIRSCSINNNEETAIYLENPDYLILSTFDKITASGNEYDAISIAGTITQSGDIIKTPIPIEVRDWIYIGDDDANTPFVTVNVKSGVVFKIETNAFDVYNEFNVQGETGANQNPIYLG